MVALTVRFQFPKVSPSWIWYWALYAPGEDVWVSPKVLFGVEARADPEVIFKPLASVRDAVIVTVLPL